MADIIRLLPDHIANQIAAGEVVQRPASVVKELLENAIDAEAKTIKLIIKDAGKTLIQVIDDGIGMSVTDIRMAFERHATSKIKTSEDLFNLRTKGFRGEALASIAAVAQVETNTATVENEVGTQIKIEGSKVVSQERIATPKGTSIAVKNLFFNIPARRNFLKSDNVELRHIIDEFQRVALPHPTISFRMYQDTGEMFNLPLDNYKRRIVQIFGEKTQEKLVPIREETNVVKLSGFIYKPEFAKKHRGEQFLFVNKRFIRSAFFHHAIINGFEGLLKEKYQPGYFIHFEVDTSTIDINIHPTKTEIKFEDDRIIYAILKSVVKRSLGQHHITPSLDFSTKENLEIPYEHHKKPLTLPKLEVDRNYNPFENKYNINTSSKQWESLYDGLEKRGHIEVESEKKIETIFDDKDIKVEVFTTQVKKKYILTSIKSGLVFINQNRAHQRIIYEKLKHEISSGIATQQLIFPIIVELNKGDFEVLHVAKKHMETMGFVFETFNAKAINMSAIPSGISEKDINTIFQDIISDFREGFTTPSFDLKEGLIKNICKSASLKNGTVLSKQLQEQLVNDLFSCQEPTLSPFQKKVFTTLTINEIDNKFN